MTTNRDRISEMLRLIETGAGPKVGGHLKRALGANWRTNARLPKSLTPASDMDAYAWLYAIVQNWRDAFQAKEKLTRPQRGRVAGAGAGSDSCTHHAACASGCSSARKPSLAS
jgi:hypothetical protein